MNCKECRNLLMEFIDNELSYDMYQAVTDHVQTCTVCSREEKEQGRIVQTLRSAAKFNPPARVWSSIQGKIEKQKETTHSNDFVVLIRALTSPQRMKLVAMAASILLIVSVLITMHSVFVGKEVNAYLEESAYFMAQLSYNEDENLFTIDDVKFGTMIEDCFL